MKSRGRQHRKMLDRSSRLNCQSCANRPQALLDSSIGRLGAVSLSGGSNKVARARKSESFSEQTSTVHRISDLERVSRTFRPETVASRQVVIEILIDTRLGKIRGILSLDGDRRISNVQAIRPCERSLFHRANIVARSANVSLLAPFSTLQPP
jgi:hypothetical protein